jgi:hypothetical protein
MPVNARQVNVLNQAFYSHHNVHSSWIHTEEDNISRIYDTTGGMDQKDLETLKIPMDGWLHGIIPYHGS